MKKKQQEQFIAFRKYLPGIQARSFD